MYRRQLRTQLASNGFQQVETVAQLLNVCSATQSLLITLRKEVRSGLSQTINATDDNATGTTPQERLRVTRLCL